MTFTWTALDTLQTASVELALAAQPFAAGLQSALARPPKIEVDSANLDLPPIRSVALKIPRVLPRIISFTFPEAPSWMQPVPASGGRKSPDTAAAPSLSASHRETSHREAETQTTTSGNPTDPAQPTAPKKLTRIKPPGDVVKLEDRLYYVLQPPLETLVRSDSLHFPFEPFPYQFSGVAFLYPRYSAILADEMGLGKTMQAITAVRMLLRSSEIRSCLLVCPKPLVTNWKREFSLWAPEIPLAIIEGDQAKRRWQWSEANTPVKIANYELLMRDRDLLENGPEGAGLHFDLVMLDEAQRIKNTNNTTSQIVRGISRSRNWALTGTPIENTPDDLVGIFEFLSPGYLKTGMTAKRMGELARDYILRRTKDMVLTDMPPKLYRDAELDLSPQQHATYQMAENEGIMQLNSMGDQITIQHVFELVLRLKQICNFDPVTGTSSKLERLEADMEEVAASGKKAIVFSQWVHTLHRMLPALERFGPLQYHGQIPSAKRDGILKEFKENPDKSVLLMSYGAGSVGLNLQFCEYVFLFDRWWNPAVEDQAINRAHRIGAKGAVTVTRMLAMGTIEERINQVLDHKRDIFNTVMDQTGAPGSLGLSQADIFGLFNLRTPKGPLKAAA